MGHLSGDSFTTKCSPNPQLSPIPFGFQQHFNLTVFTPNSITRPHTNSSLEPKKQIHEGKTPFTDFLNNRQHIQLNEKQEIFTTPRIREKLKIFRSTIQQRFTPFSLYSRTLTFYSSCIMNCSIKKTLFLLFSFFSLKEINSINLLHSFHIIIKRCSLHVN